jgi:hypothetical protein
MNSAMGWFCLNYFFTKFKDLICKIALLEIGHFQYLKSDDKFSPAA